MMYKTYFMQLCYAEISSIHVETYTFTCKLIIENKLISFPRKVKLLFRQDEILLSNVADMKSLITSSILKQQYIHTNI